MDSVEKGPNSQEPELLLTSLTSTEASRLPCPVPQIVPPESRSLFRHWCSSAQQQQQVVRYSHALGSQCAA